MLYFIYLYMLSLLSLLAVTGEMDRRWGSWVCERLVPELSTRHAWYWPPITSLAVPGGGQLLNQQPVKALICFLWPFLLLASHRPGQTDALTLRLLVALWYVLVFADAFVSSLTLSGARRSRLRRHQKSR